MSSQNPWYPGGPIKIAGKLMFIPQTTAISPYGLTQASIKGDPRTGWMHNIPTSSNGYPKSIQYPKPSQEGCCSVLFNAFYMPKKNKKSLCPRSHLGPLRSIQRSTFRAPRCANAQPGYIAAREAIGPSCAAQRGPFSMAQLGDCPGFLWEFNRLQPTFLQQIPWVFRCCPISCTQKVLKPTHFQV